MEVFQPNSRISVHLEDGADSAELLESDLSLSRRGMLMRCHWHFTIGTQLSILIDASRDSESTCRLRLEGIVVDSRPCQDEERVYCTTLLFLDAPDDLEIWERSDAGALLAF